VGTIKESPMRLSFLLPLFASVACSSPSEHYLDVPPVRGAGGANDAPPPGEPPGDEAHGPAGEPVLGGGGDDGEWADLTCAPSHLSIEQHGMKRGEGVELSGTISTSLDTEGSELLLEVLAEAQGDDQGPANLVSYVCSAVGPFTLELPKELGEARLVAYLAEPGEGPSDDDPAGLSAASITVGTKAIAGVAIEIVKRPDLGPYSPSALQASIPPASGEGVGGAEALDDGVEGPEGTDAPLPAEGDAPPPAEGDAPPPAEGDAPPPAEGDAPPPAEG
jgi:hypothetical protein